VIVPATPAPGNTSTAAEEAVIREVFLKGHSAEAGGRVSTTPYTRENLNRFADYTKVK
jgi:hypothetical protein